MLTVAASGEIRIYYFLSSAPKRNDIVLHYFAFHMYIIATRVLYNAWAQRILMLRSVDRRHSLIGHIILSSVLLQRILIKHCDIDLLHVNNVMGVTYGQYHSVRGIEVYYRLLPSNK